MPERRRALLAVLPLLALGSATPASAIPARFATVEHFEGHLQLVGDRVAWSDRRCVRGCGENAFGSTDLARFLIKSFRAPPDELARTRLTTVPGGANYVIEDAEFAASATRAVMVELEEGSRDDEPYSDARVFTGALGGPLSRLLNCDASQLPFALDGDQLAYDEPRCVESSTQIVVRSLITGAERGVPTEGASRTALTVAGDFLAVVSSGAGRRAPGQIAVWNLATGSKTGSVAVPATQAVAAFGLFPSGALTYIVRDPSDDPCARSALSVLDPGAPAPRQLAPRVCGEALPAGDVVVTRTEDRLVGIPLSGGAPRPVLDLGTVLPADVAAGDGGIAYALPGCAGDTTIHRFALGGSLQDAGAAGCPVRIPRQRLRIRRDRRIPVRLRCPRGCAGTLSLFVGSRFLVRRDFERSPGRSRVALRAPRALVSRVQARGGLVRGRLETATFDRTGEVRQRTRRLPLRSP